MFIREEIPVWKHMGRAVLFVAPLFLFLLPNELMRDENSICLFRNLTGNTCYGCGLTHALAALLHLKLQEAWEYNHLVMVVAPGLAYIWMRNMHQLTNSWFRKSSD